MMFDIIGQALNDPRLNFVASLYIYQMMFEWISD
jgi:hypothetical protein